MNGDVTMRYIRIFFNIDNIKLRFLLLKEECSFFLSESDKCGSTFHSGRWWTAVSPGDELAEVEGQPVQPDRVGERGGKVEAAGAGQVR